MKTLYLDIFSGISGDMFIGAMLDLGVDAHAFEHELEKLGLSEYHLHVSRQERGSIAGVKFDVHLAHGRHAHSHEHSHGEFAHTHEHEHPHSHGNDRAMRMSTGRIVPIILNKKRTDHTAGRWSRPNPVGWN
jgi:uncharacterized protein (DUF111 family)